MLKFSGLLKNQFYLKEMLKKDKILVLGGSGFIGTNLLKKLKEKGFKNLFATSYSKKKFLIIISKYHQLIGCLYLLYNSHLFLYSV